jgi:UDP-glucose 4-epimerase
MITVTGGAGFIGSHIVDELLVQGEEVTVIDNFSEGTMDNLERWRRHPKLHIARVDIREKRDVELAMRGSWAVFHLAAMSRIQPSITDPILAWEQNVIGTGNVLEAARNLGVKRVVYSASSSAYGRRNEPPLTEDMPTDCLNPYSLSKKVGEEMMDVYLRLYGLSTVSLRYFNVYGPRHQEEGNYATVIAIFRKQKRLCQKMTIVGDGEQRRDFTFVGDVVRANLLALMNNEATGVINIGTGINHSINDVAKMIEGDYEYIPPRLGEAQLTLANRDKAWRVLGWEPNVTLQQGLQVLDMYEKKYPKSGIVIAGSI